MTTETTSTIDHDMTADPKQSPDFLATPKKGKGVRRLNRIPILVVGGLLTLAVAGITYTFFQRQAQNNAPARKEEQAPVEVIAKPPVRPVGGDYVQPTMPVEVVPTETATAGQPTETGGQVGQVAAGPSEAYQQRMRLIQQVEERRLAKLEAALDSEVSVQAFTQGRQAAADGAQGGADGAAGAAGQGGARFDPLAQYMAAAGAGASMGGMPGMGEAGGQNLDPNRQAQKRAFLSGTADAETYLAHTRKAGISPAQEVKAGTIIPGVMVGGINSDLPGQIIGQVRENVYDSATGQNLLIPAGARLVGTYDSGVTLGQRRALVAWTRIIYPDGSSLSLNMMPGADQGGYAGFNDKVDNHYWRIFGNGLMLSLFAAGIQLSQPEKNTGDGYDSQQIIAAELGRQMGQLGMEMTRRNMDIQPTLEIRPGYMFNVMVTKDIILPPWQGHPLAAR